MAKAKPWLKMWVESLDDPKMLRLTLTEEATWWRLLRLAQRCTADGSLITSSGSPLTTEEIATCLHITSPDDVAAFDSMLKKMEAEGSLCWNNKTLYIIHFTERQEMVPSETPEAIRGRVRLYRERHRVTETPLQPDELPPTLIDQINNQLSNIPPGIDRLAEHEAIKQKLADIGEGKGFTVKSEVPIGPAVGPHGPRRIDLCWLHNGQILAAFEIDYKTPKEASIEKLRLAHSANGFIITREPNLQILRVTDVTQEKREPEKRILEKEEEKEEEEEEEDRRYVTAGNPLHTHEGNGKSVTAPDTLGPVTPASQYLFEKTKRKRWANLVQKEEFEKVEDQVGFPKMKNAIDWALTSGIANIKSILTAAKRGRKEKGKSSAEEKEKGASFGRQESGAEGRGTGTHREDTQTSDKFGGFKVLKSGPGEPDVGDQD